MPYLLFNKDRGLGLYLKPKNCDGKQNKIDKKANKHNNKKQQQQQQKRNVKIWEFSSYETSVKQFMPMI